MRVRVTVFLAETIELQLDKGPGQDKAGIQLPTQSDEQVTDQVTEQVRRLLVCLKEKPLGGRDAMRYLGLNHRPTFMYDYLKPAIQTGFVEMTQPDSPKSPTQKYRLTVKGKAFLTDIPEEKGNETG